LLGKAPLKKDILDQFTKLGTELKGMEKTAPNLKVFLKAMGFKVETLKAGQIYSNPLFSTSNKLSALDIKSNRSGGFDTFVIASFDVGLVASAALQIIFFQPHSLYGVLGSQAIGFYGALSLESKIGSTIKATVFSNSVYLTPDRPPFWIPPSPDLPNGGFRPPWPLNP
jgi:hypothetical protein